MNNKIIIIGGPTASYKSEVALRLANEFNGEIINADSMQIYHDLPILSAQPTKADKEKCPHYLYGCVNAGINYSVAEWLSECTKIINFLHQQKKIPIVVGGTGLYINSLVKGLAEIPAIEDTTKNYCQEQLAKYGYEWVYNFLATIDQQIFEKIHPNDKQRILRAYEVYTQTNITIFAHHKQTKAPFNEGQFYYIISDLNREELYSRCDQRIKLMLKLGAVEEVKDFAKQNLNPKLSIFNTIGVKPLLQFLEKELSLDQALNLWQQETRNFAKRQVTWFKNQLPAIKKYNYTSYQDLDKISKTL